MNTYKDKLIKIGREHKEKNGTGIILIDFDIFQSSNDFTLSLFSCEMERLPDYALAKLKKLDKASNCFALKHTGLCLITELA
tara:strand:- start:148 stop:393 length:246 start_codon:yes stop_codon:yes gene_type:complete